MKTLNCKLTRFFSVSTGSGDVDTSKVVQADSDGLICGASGDDSFQVVSLFLNRKFAPLFQPFFSEKFLFSPCIYQPQLV